MTKRSLTATVLVLLALLASGGWWYFHTNAPGAEKTATSPAENRPREASVPRQQPEAPAAPKNEAEWTTYHGDSGLRGVADGALPERLAVLWRFKAGGPVRETPVVHDRRVFFATARGEVIAVDLNGQRVWSQELFTGEERKGIPVHERIEAPVASVDDLVLAGTSRGFLYALDAVSGREKWRAKLEGPILGSPNYLRSTADGQPSRIYVIDQARGALQCLDAGSGGLLWRSEEITRCDGSPAVSADAVVFGSCAAALHVFSPESGKLLRNIEIDEDSQVAGGVALDGGLVISGSRSGKVLQAEINTGKILWVNTASETEVFSTPAVTADSVVAACSDGNVFALERGTGALRWQFDTKGMPTSAAIAGDKAVVAADGELFVLKLADGAKVWSFKVSDEITAPAVAEGMVFVGSEDGTVVAFGAAQKQGGAEIR